MHGIIIRFLIKASSRNAMRKKYRSKWGCYYFLFEKKMVKRFVQFVQSSPGQGPTDKYPPHTSHRSRFVYKYFTCSFIW
jgi:hypothetical protein